jgi:hypothetical protein
MGGIMFGVERNKEHYFVENICLVVNGEIIREVCENDSGEFPKVYPVDPKNVTLTDSGNFRFSYPCYEPLWTVQYNITTDTIFSIESAQISGSTSAQYDTAVDKLNEHLVSIARTAPS